MSQKPAVPVNYITNKCWDDIYVGDDEAQTRAIETMVGGMKKGVGGIYIIYGPTRTGKEECWNEATRKLKKTGANVHVVDHQGRQDLIDEHVGLHDTGHNIVRVADNISPTHLEKYINHARQILKKYPNSSIVVESLDMVPRLPDKAEPSELPIMQKEQKTFEALRAKNPDIIVVRTRQNLEQMKSEVWDLNQQLFPHYSNTGDAINEQLLHCKKDQDVKALIAALNENNKDKYNLAFQRFIEMDAQHKR